MKNRLLYLPIAAAAATVTLIASAQFSEPLRKLSIAESAVKQLYVDSVDEEKLVEDAIKGMLQGLDPHSSYTTAEETREANEPLEGNFTGVGVTYNLNRDTIYIISTISGGPAQKVGVREGDRIIAINDTNVAGVKIKTRDIQKKLRGPKGTNVNVRVLRKSAGANDTINFKITRDEIPIYSIDAAYMVDPTTGFIRINKFAAETYKEFTKAVNDLKKKGMKNLIIDLTDNGGGYLVAASDILGELLPEGSMTVYTEGLNSPRNNMTASPGNKTPLLEDARIVVMVNQYTASASEITSGAIQDWDRGVIVGRRTFGKGLVQRPITFPDGSMIRLTVAHYYTPTGRDIQKPYTKGDSKAYAQDILDRFNRGELMHEDSIHYIDSLKVSTLRTGRTIYGGGGISPDKFVPLDTMSNTKYYRDLTAKGVINSYVIKYVDENRKAIKKKYKNDDIYVAEFEVTPEMIEEIKVMGDAEGVTFNEEQYQLSTPLISMIVKGLIGRDIYNNETYFKVYNRWDPIFLEALKIINSDEYDKLLNQ